MYNRVLYSSECLVSLMKFLVGMWMYEEGIMLIPQQGQLHHNLFIPRQCARFQVFLWLPRFYLSFIFFYTVIHRPVHQFEKIRYRTAPNPVETVILGAWAGWIGTASNPDIFAQSRWSAVSTRWTGWNLPSSCVLRQPRVSQPARLRLRVAPCLLARWRAVRKC